MIEDAWIYILAGIAVYLIGVAYKKYTKPLPQEYNTDLEGFEKIAEGSLEVWVKDDHIKIIQKDAQKEEPNDDSTTS